MISKVTDSIFYIGANDHDVDLFEGQYVVPNGMCYNSYFIADGKTAVFDTIAEGKTEEWLGNIQQVLDMVSAPVSKPQINTAADFFNAAPNQFAAASSGNHPDYLIVQHMEPDHSASIQAFVEKYPDTTVVANKKTFEIMYQFFPEMTIKNTLEVAEGDTLSLGMHNLTFIFAPMVHWPEVMVTYESTEKVLFSADGFGKFGALDREEPWLDEARRYYIGIVGKYGDFVQDLLGKASGVEIQTICPLHGPVLKEDLGYYLDLYNKWSSYTPEDKGVVIAYTSVYGHTKEAVFMLRDELVAKGVPNVEVYDLARDDQAKAVDAAFKYDKLVLATTTYNSEIYPFMHHFIIGLTERNFQKRTVGLIENGSWAPTAAGIMKEMFDGCKDITFAENTVTIKSALNDKSRNKLMKLADEMAKGYAGARKNKAEPVDTTALFKIGYGLYVVTCNDGIKENGLIVNTVSQVSDNPNRVAVNINKMNYSCDVIRNTGILNVCTLNEDATFDVFKHFGFQSGRDVNKFDDFTECERAANGLPFLTKHANAFLSLKVFGTVDMGTHWMFLCDVTESEVLNDVPTITYNYYQANVKPQPKTEVQGWVCDTCGNVYEGEELPDDYECPLCKQDAGGFHYGTADAGSGTKWVCNICGYEYEGDELPEDFVCPTCKHGASDFTKIG